MENNFLISNNGILNYGSSSTYMWEQTALTPAANPYLDRAQSLNIMPRKRTLESADVSIVHGEGVQAKRSRLTTDNPSR